MANEKKIFFCIDYEDWYHIPYLKKYNFNKNDYSTFADKVDDFMNWLSENGIVANLFVIGEIAKDNQAFLKKCFESGHEIGCHSWSHLPMNGISDEEFVSDTVKAKKAIEEAIGHEIRGYRAPFFSLTNEKLALLPSLGFSYDSSYINSNANEFYNKMELTSFTKKDSLIYEKNGFFEYEIPTLKNKPIAGGGFFRLYPFFLFKRYVEKFAKENNNFIFFIHPFEIAGTIPFDGLKKMGLKDRIRFQLGRKTVLKKLKKTLLYFKNKGYVFSKF